MFSIFFIILYLQVFRVWWDGRSKMYDSQIVLLWYFRTFDNIQECFLLKGLTIRESCTFHFQRVERTQIRLMLVCTFEWHMHKMCCILNFEYVSKMTYISPRGFRENCWTFLSVYNIVLTWNILWERSKRERKTKMDSNRKHLGMKMCTWKWLFHQPIVNRKNGSFDPVRSFGFFDVYGGK